MNDQDLLARIQALVEEEHQLRGSSTDAESSTGDDQRARLQRVEEELDQCWDLLRQRRAKQDAGADPQEAKARPVDQVEDYRQ